MAAGQRHEVRPRLALIACREASGDVLVAAVADEEHASLGVQEVLASFRADAAIVTEPTSSS